MTRKRTSTTPNPGSPWPKARKKDEPESRPPVSHNAPHSMERSVIGTAPRETGQGHVPDAPTPTRRSPRFKCVSQELSLEALADQPGLAPPPDKAWNGEEPEECSSPSQCHLQAQDNSDVSLVITLDDEQHRRRRRGKRRKGGVKKRRGVASGEGGGADGPESGQEGEGREEGQIEVEIDQQLDRELESKSRQHNLTSVNVRNIIHEVITNEHVVAMMKAAISETEVMPVFEPKMTRSKLKEVVEKGVVIPTWTISPMKKTNEQKPPQFVDIPLEEEDSSDEEYCPDEDEEDETAEETFLESDIESTASSPRGSRGGLARAAVEDHEDRNCSPTQRSHKARHLRVEVVPMGPPPPPQPAGPPRPPRAPPECSFMEKLHAVEEELAISPIILETYQALGTAGGEGGSLMACRTRSKRTLRDVPLGRLEAELRAPDITPDMYDCGSAPEDREWTHWLQGLMTSDMENEEEGDDEDDPEYNFLADTDEPDVEDYRNDRAVRITKKEVSELMEELFETFQDELGVQEQDEEGHEEEEEREEEAPPQDAPKFNIPQTIRFDEPLANMLTECHRTVKEQLAALRRHRAQLESQALGGPQDDPAPSQVLLPPALVLSHPQKQQLQQQIQQHVQLLTQAHMLSCPVESLQSEVITTRLFLSELESFAQRGEQACGATEPGFISIFRACNLQGALSLLEELRQSPAPQAPVRLKPARSAGAASLPLLPPDLAWLLATRPVFMYPELLPLCSLDPTLHTPRTNSIYTRGEDGLLVLGLRNFAETRGPYDLVCQYLIRTKGPKQLRRHIHDMCHHRSPDNVIKFYFRQKIVPPMPLACGKVKPGEQRPSVEREERVLPMWLRKSVPYIHEAVLKYNRNPQEATPQTKPTMPPYVLPPGTRYPPKLPGTLTLHPTGFKRSRHTSVFPPYPTSGDSTDPSSAAPFCLGGATAGAEQSAQWVPLCKLLPIQPAPPKPPPPPLQVVTISVEGALNVLDLEGGVGVATVASNGAKAGDQLGAVFQNVSPTFIINMTAPLATAVLCPTPAGEGLAWPPGESVVPPQGAVAQVYPALTQLRRLGRPLLPAPPRQKPPVASLLSPPDSATKTRSKPEFFPYGPAALLPNPPGRKGIREKVKGAVPPKPSSDPQKLSASWDVADIVSVGQSAGAPSVHAVSGSHAGAVEPELKVVQNLFHLLPQNGGIGVNEAPPGLSPSQPGRPQRGSAMTPAREQPTAPKPDLGRPQNSPTTVEVLRLGWGEEEEEEEEEGEEQCGGSDEEEEVGDIGAPLLALSESSGSPASSLGRMEEEEGEGRGWSGLQTSTPQHSPLGLARGAGEWRGGGQWRTLEEDGLDDVTKDGEEEEVMSPVSLESVLSVPELQETMEKLTMLATEGRTEDENSPSSPSPAPLRAAPASSAPQNSEEGKELRPREGGANESAGRADPSQARGRRAGRGRGYGCRAHPNVRRRGRKEQDGQDLSKPPSPHDDRALDNDPLRESKDMAFAQAYLSRVCAAVQDVPGKVEEFLGVLREFEQGIEGRSLVELFAQLRAVLRDWPELLRDFAAFLQPEQARECGLLVEQQAFERSRRFLRQLEMSFGESPSHYQRIVHALQEGPSLSHAGLEEMKAQMASLLKHHANLQEEFWEFFNELQAASSRPTQTEDVAHSEVKEGATEGQRPKGGAKKRLKKSKPPVSEERKEPRKAGPMTVRSSKKQGLGRHNTGKECDWSTGGKDKACRGSSRKAKPRRVNRKHGSVSRRTKKCVPSPLGSSTLPPVVQEKRPEERGEGGREENGPRPEREQDEKKREQEARKDGGGGVCDDAPDSLPNLPSPSLDPPVCAKNVSLTASGEKVILWTREADRIILTACQKMGANQSTFQGVSNQLGIKTANEVSLRFRELMLLFRTAAAAHSEDQDQDQDQQSASDED